jgi:hypothetical protein
LRFVKPEDDGSATIAAPENENDKLESRLSETLIPLESTLNSVNNGSGDAMSSGENSISSTVLHSFDQCLVLAYRQTITMPLGFLGFVAAIGYSASVIGFLISTFVRGSLWNVVDKAFDIKENIPGSSHGEVDKEGGSEALGLAMYGVEFYANQLDVTKLIHYVFGVSLTTAVANRVITDTGPLILVSVPVCNDFNSRPVYNLCCTCLRYCFVCPKRYCFCGHTGQLLSGKLKKPSV